jgi:ATP-dependent exoDNAse (exonuclease V) beta subunit
MNSESINPESINPESINPESINPESINPESLKPELYHVLSTKNEHNRDKHIKFFEEDHKYIIDLEPDTKYTSVTTWIHEHFEKFDSDKIIKKMMSSSGWKEGHKYWGKTSDEIKNLWNSNKDSLAEAGTNLHYEIECFYNDKRLHLDYTNNDLVQSYFAIKKEEELYNKPIEWKYFINFVMDHPHLKPYRTEWTVFNEDIKISGSIDMVYENHDGTLSIYDWKRCKNITRINQFNKFATKPLICHLPDSNFWHYALQLNTYKYILESKYNKKVTDLYLVKLHPNDEDKNYELIKLPDLSTEIKDLLKERINEFN